MWTQPRPRCPFCDGDLSVAGPKVHNEGETGGIWIVTDYECAGCTALVRNDVVMKIGYGHEQWRIQRPPARVTTTGRIPCPACQGRLVSAWPAGAPPEPASCIDATRAPTTERTSEHLCTACSARYLLHEHVESRWTRDGEPVAIRCPPGR